MGELTKLNKLFELENNKILRPFWQRTRITWHRIQTSLTRLNEGNKRVGIYFPRPFIHSTHR